MRVVHVVEDDQNVRELLGRYLQREGYTVFLHSCAEELLPSVAKEGADLFVLDITLPAMDGLELCKMIRVKYSTPIIFVSARSEEFDRILGIELGGDDYLVKPFSPRELLVRIKAIFRRMEHSQQLRHLGLTFKDLSIDSASRQLKANGASIELTTKEYDLLEYLVGNAGRAFTREQLVSAVWGYSYVGDSRSVDDLVRRLRRKLDGISEVRISTVWDYGYRIDA